jgi:hypothetical protein
MCTKEGEALESVCVDAGYLFTHGHLSGLHLKLDSAAAFDPLLAAFTKRCGQPQALRRGTVTHTHSGVSNRENCT